MDHSAIRYSVTLRAVDTTDIAFAGAAEQARMLVAGSITAPALLELYLDRIARVDREVRSYRVVLADRARAEAKAAQERLAAGERLPLLGVPIAIKDDVDVADEFTCYGSSAHGLPPTADDYLWGEGSPFNKLRRFKGPENEYKIIVSESLRRYPLTSLATGLWGALRQFFMFRTGDGISPQQWVLDPEFQNFMPRQYGHYLKGRQQLGILRFESVNVVQYPLALMAQIWLGCFLWKTVKRRRWNRAALPAFVFLALIGNALVCGLFSGPHDRYQSRLIWVVPFALLLTARPRLHPVLR